MPIHIHRDTVIAHHLVHHGYGHWLGNDPRGSGSTELRQEKFEDLGPIHLGRKRKQPSREELRAFYVEAEQRLEHPIVWFDEPMRIVIADALSRVVQERGWTCWACAVVQNHAHTVMRVHRAEGHLMWDLLARASRDALWDAGLVPRDHPVWSNRPYVVFKTTVRLVEVAIGYTEKNPEKHKLPRQVHPWVQKYDGWPLRWRR